MLAYVFTVEDITVDGGILNGDFTISFDPNVFEFQSVDAVEIDHWQMNNNTNNAASGSIRLIPMDSDGIGDNAVAVTESGRIKYNIHLKVKATTEKNTIIKVSSGMVADSELNNISDGTLGSLTITIKQKLATPDIVSFDNGTAKWTAVENAGGYSIQIYKNNSEFGDAIPVGADETEKDLSTYMTKSGKYTFTVTAVNGSAEYEPSDESTQSPEYVKVGDLEAPTIRLTPDNENGGLKYQITDTNENGTVKEYKITLYDVDGTVVNTFSTPNLAGTIQEGTVTGGIQYSASVQAIAKDETNNDSAESARSAAATAAKKVDTIAISTLPTLSYTDGQKLDLSDMVVEIKYADGTSEKVKFADFDSYGITCNMQNGKKLTTSDSGSTLTVSFGGKSSSQKITVTSTECKHTSTHKVRQEPTCGDTGYENEVCDKCGAVISSRTLEATGNHSYGQWEIIINPTSTVKGQKQHSCSVCGKVEIEDIPPLGTESAEPLPPDTDIADTTRNQGGVIDNNTSDGGKKNLDDLSKIFLIIVLVIFGLIILFIILGILLENRRAQARRKKKKRSANATKRR
ncbi:MAG: hypothetical protein J5563_02250 [Clostridia bacterium]|nr:hypothetical protein [Clostridia bacterium]